MLGAEFFVACGKTSDELPSDVSCTLRCLQASYVGRDGVRQLMAGVGTRVRWVETCAGVACSLTY